MNILFLSSYLIAPQKGGISRVTSVLADEFARRGNGVFYLSLPAETHRNAVSERQFFLPENDFGSEKNKAFFLDFLKDKKINIVINQNGRGKDGSRFAYTAKGHGIPVVSVCHSGLVDVARNFRFSRGAAWKQRHLGWLLPLTDLRLAKKILLALYKKKYQAHFHELCEKSDRVVLLSESFKPDMAFYFDGNACPQNVISISNPASFAATGDPFPSKRRELLYVGRLERGEKRVDLLLTIWARLEKRFPEWSLRIVGDGSDAASLRALAGTLGLERVHFEGFQNPAPYYRDASIFCMTSAFEGFGMVLVESAAFGCVPVAFESFAAVRDIIDDGENGRLVPAFDLDAYAGTLARLMSDDALRERLAKNALAQIPAKFSPEKIAAQWEALFAQLCSGKRKA